MFSAPALFLHEVVEAVQSTAEVIFLPSTILIIRATMTSSGQSPVDFLKITFETNNKHLRNTAVSRTKPAHPSEVQEIIQAK